MCLAYLDFKVWQRNISISILLQQTLNSCLYTKRACHLAKHHFNKLKTVSYLIKNANKFHNVKVACFIREATFSFVSLMYCTFRKAVCHYSVTFWNRKQVLICTVKLASKACFWIFYICRFEIWVILHMREL